MGLSLRNIAKKIYDDVNVFDGGKSQGNPTGAPRVAAPTPVRPQAPVQSPGFRPTPVFGAGQVNLSALNINHPVAPVKPAIPGSTPAPVRFAGSVGNAAIAGERSTAQVLARLLPGGQNDIKAQNAAIDQKNRDRQFIQSQVQAGKMAPAQAAKVFRAQNTDPALVSSIAQTQKSIPSRFQAATGVASTAADILTAGTLPAVKFAATPAAKLGVNLATNATAGGLNAAAGGGSAKTIAENAAAGALLPETLRGGAKVAFKGSKVGLKAARDPGSIKPMNGRQAIQAPSKPGASPKVVTPSVEAPKIAVKDAALKRPKQGASVTDNLDYLVNRHIDSTSTAPKLKNSFIRGLTDFQEKAYRQPVDKARDAANDLITKGLTSKNSVVSKVTAAPNTLFNRFGLKDETRNILRIRNGQQENAGRVVRQITNDLGDHIGKTSDPKATLKNVDRYFEQPDYLARAYGQGTKKLGYNKLAPEEKHVVDTMVDLNKMRNGINLKLGKINREQFVKYSNGRHSPRIYDLETRKKGGANAGGGSLMDTSVSKKRVALKDVKDDVFDKRETSPVMRSMVRMEIALRDEATHDALAQLEKKGLLKKNAPNGNFSKLQGDKYGRFKDMHIYNPVRSELDKHIAYNTESGAAVGKLIDKYQGSKLGELDRFFKSTKTTLSPGTFAGNVVSNPVAFNSAAGVNPLTQSKNMIKAAVKLNADSKGKFDKSLYEARKQGVGVDDTGKQLTGDRRSGGLTVDNKRSKNPAKVAGSVYGGVDRSAQVALYDELIARGLTPEVAARRVAAGTQDYGNAGRLIHNLADSPILGKPFARFTPELARLTKNNILYNPVGTALKIGAVAKGADYLSHKSGETEQERNARENAVGQTQIPGTSIINRLATGRNKPLSLNFAVPGKNGNGSAVNIARLTGLNYPIDPGGNANTALVNQALPFALPVRKDAQGSTKFAPNEAFSSLTARPLADQAVNRDFLGRQVSDPENKTRIEGVGPKGLKFSDEPSIHDQLNNRLRAAGAAYVPGFNEANAVYTAKRSEAAVKKGKDPIKDYYGKERSPVQAVLRSVGIKTESNSKDARKSRVDTQEYFDGSLGQVNKFLRDNPDLKNSYANIVSTSIDRKTNTRTNDIISPEKWKIVAGDKSGKLYDQLKTEALYANTHSKDKSGNGRPIDPIYQLNSPERVKEVTELRSRPTGDDTEREEILRATAPWYPKFEQAQRDYFAANDKYYKNLPKFSTGGEPPKQNPRVEAYNNVPFAKQSDLVAEYYKVKGADPAQGKAFYKTHATQLSTDFDKYKVDRLKEINGKRAIEGHAPISQDTFNNVTFGYEDDEAKVAKELSFKLGDGGYGSGKKKASFTNPYSATVKNTQTQVAKPKVSIKAPTLPAKRAKAKSKVAFKITKSRI